MVDLLGGGDGLRWQLGWLLAGMRGVHRLHGDSARLCTADTHRACSSADASAAPLPGRDRAGEQRRGWLRHCMSMRHSAGKQRPSSSTVRHCMSIWHSARKQRPSSSIARQQATAHQLVVYVGFTGLAHAYVYAASPLLGHLRRALAAVCAGVGI